MRDREGEPVAVWVTAGDGVRVGVREGEGVTGGERLCEIVWVVLCDAEALNAGVMELQVRERLAVGVMPRETVMEGEAEAGEGEALI